MIYSEYIKNSLIQFNNTAIDSFALDLASEFALSTTTPCFTLIKSLAKGIMQTTMIKCFNDISERSLSTIEEQKLDLIFNTAEETFWSLAKANEWENNVNDFSLEQYAFETAEHMILEGLKQYDKEKMKILGRFYGKTFYYGSNCWDDLHQKIGLVGELTYRQIVFIYFLEQNLLGHSQEESITNSTACVEINQLINYGICQTTDLIIGGTNKSSPIKLSFIKVTDYAKQLYDDLLLDDLNSNDIQKIISTLDLKIV